MRTNRVGPLIAATLAAVAACGVAEVPTPVDEDAAVMGEVLELSEGARIAYAGTFDWEDAVLTDGSYTFETDLGFQFRIDVFQLATTSIQLRPCEAEDEEAAASWPRWGIRNAYADHVVSDDPSIALVDRAEDAFAPSPQELAVGTASGEAYCHAFLRAAVLSESAPGLEGNTIAIAGAYLPPDEDLSGDKDWVSFDAWVPLGDGMLEELTAQTEAPLPPAGSDDVDVDVIVTRFPVRAFQSLDPRDLDAAEFAWEVLGNVLHRSTVGVHLR